VAKPHKSFATDVQARSGASRTRIVCAAQSPTSGRKMKASLRAFTAILALLLLPNAFADQARADGVVKLPLPYRGDEVRRQINAKLLLVVSPESDGGVDIEAVEPHAESGAFNLLYHSDEWHGPYPTQVYAWHVAKGYFPNSRWVCVRGYPVEVHITIEHPKVKEVGDEAVFQGGTLVLAWFKRPCTRGFGHESDTPGTALHSDRPEAARP
jgi:hypothetical protein